MCHGDYSVSNIITRKCQFDFAGAPAIVNQHFLTRVGELLPRELILNLRDGEEGGVLIKGGAFI